MKKKRIGEGFIFTGAGDSFPPEGGEKLEDPQLWSSSMGVETPKRP